MENIIHSKNKYYFKTETGYREILASTDESLGLPRPSNEFLKKYCELGGIEEVLIEVEARYLCNKCNAEKINHLCKCGEDSNYKQDFKLKVSPDNTITIKPVKDSWNRLEVVATVANVLNSFCQQLDIKYQKGFLTNWIKQNL